MENIMQRHICSCGSRFLKRKGERQPIIWPIFFENCIKRKTLNPDRFKKAANGIKIEALGSIGSEIIAQTLTETDTTGNFTSTRTNANI